MNIVLLNPYGPLPTEGWRKYRFILFGEALAKSGHNVQWYTSSYSHHFKKQRKEQYRSNFSNFKVDYIKSIKYRSNVGLMRLLSEIIYSFRVYKKLKKNTDIDVVIAADPSQFVGFTARMLSRRLGARLILDFMDEWPELFLKSASKYAKPLVYLATLPLFVLRRYNYLGAHGVTALGKNYLNIATGLAKPGTFRRLIYNGIDRQTELCKSLESEAYTSNGRLCAIYAGSLGMKGDNYDVKAITILAQNFNSVDFYVAGAGDGLLYLKEIIKSSRLENLYLLGNLKKEDLDARYSLCDIGLALYGKASNVDMPDKFYDYINSGLAVVSSLQGEVKDIIVSENLGITYKPGDYSSLIKKFAYLISDKDHLKQIKSNSINSSVRFRSERQFSQISILVDEVSCLSTQ